MASRQFTVWLLTLWLLALAFPYAAQAQDADDGQQGCLAEFAYYNQLMRAETAYVKRQYEHVLVMLEPLLAVPECLEDPATRIEVELLAGVAYLELGQEEAADAHFLRVLRMDPDYEIGSIITLPEGSAQRLEWLRSQHAAELDALRGHDNSGVVVEPMYILTETKERAYWINFLPFGAGQFQLEDTEWGIAYAALQGLSLSMTVVGASVVEFYRKDTMKFSKQDYPKAKAWQYVQIAGIASFGAFYLASIIHAMITYEPTHTIVHPPSQNRPDTISHSVYPLVYPNGGGLGYDVIF